MTKIQKFTHPVDGLKFDGSFLQAAETNRRGLALMRNVARMCAELGISSVGERIETESDRQMLIEAGVMYAQGYFYGRPAIMTKTSSRAGREPCAARHRGPQWTARWSA